MHHRYPTCPTRWLMTDERMGAGLWTALDRLPRGAGVVFRHHSLAASERRSLFAAVAKVARRRRLLLLRAGGEPFRGEQGMHGRSRHHQKSCRRLLKTWPAHNPAEVVAGRRAGADLIFISPIFATRSHPGGRPLGPIRAAALARLAGGKAIALGGVDERRFRRLRLAPFVGYAAIDAWSGR